MLHQDKFDEHQRFLTEKQVAELLHQSVRTLQKWRGTGQGPAFHKFGNSVRYLLSNIVHWIARSRIPHTSPDHRRSLTR